MERSIGIGGARNDVSEALSVLLEVQNRGVSVWVEKRQLRFRAPKGALEPADLDELRRFKEEIIALLQDDAADAGNPLTRRSAQDAIPLTDLQRSIWTKTHALGRWTRTHAFAIRITGRLQIERLDRALNYTARHHEILRTRLTAVSGDPIQSISGNLSERLCVIDASGDQIDLPEAILEFVDSTVDATNPLFDARLFCLAADDFVLVVSLDQLITDCRSNDLVSRSIWNHYLANEPDLDERVDVNRLQFSDYAVWLRGYYSDWRDAHASYWLGRFSDYRLTAASENRRLSVEHQPQLVRDEVSLDPNSTNQLLEFARRMDTYLAVIMLTAYLMAAGHFYGISDLICIAIDGGRHRPELKTLVGPLVNHLYLRVEATADMSFVQLIRSVSRELDGAYQHRDFNWLHSLVPGLEAHVYFNWVTDDGFDPRPTAEETAAGGISLQPYPLERSGYPPALVGLTLRHSQQIRGSLVHEPAPRASGADSDMLELLSRAWKGGVRKPESSIRDILADAG